MKMEFRLYYTNDQLSYHNKHNMHTYCKKVVITPIIFPFSEFNIVSDLLVYPLIELINLCPQVLRVEIKGSLFVGLTEIIKLRVEVANDLGRFIVHNHLLLLIEEHRNRETSTVVFINNEIDLPEMIESVNGIWSTPFYVWIKPPPLLTHVVVNHIHGDAVFKPLEATDNQGTVGPGTGVGYVEVVATVLSRKSTTAVLGHTLPEGACLSHEFSLLVGPLEDV